MKTIALLAIAAVLATSCSDAKTPEEEADIKRMDSVSQAVKDSTRRLEEQTKKVEASLEKLDKEFESGNQNK
jgi:hypothetical protein